MAHPAPVPVRLLEREAPLAALQHAVDEAASAHGRLVLIAGESGVGKTALIRQLILERPECQLVLGACEPLDPPEALGPLFEMASSLGPEVQAHLAGAPRRTELFASIVKVLQGAREPWLMVFEDIHWADQATLELVRYLGRRVDRLPATVIATYRSDYALSTTPLAVVLGDLATTPAVERLDLQPLSEPATVRLAEGSGADPHQLFERTGGNPFFITEVLAAGAEGVPTTVRDAVLARLARLAPETRDALRVAAALGRRFEAELLATILDSLGLPRWTMRDAVFAGMLRWEGPALGFRHALAQAAIAESIAAEPLQRLHRAIFTELERSASGPDAYAALVLHAEAAGQDDAVLHYAPLAAARAAALSAHRESAALYAKAVARARREPPARRADLTESYANQLYHSAELAASIQQFQFAAQLWREAGDNAGFSRSMTRVAAIGFLLGRYADALRAEDKALATLERLPPSRELELAYENRSRRLFMEQDPSAAEQWGLRALELANRHGDPDAILNARVCVEAARLLAANVAARSELVDCHRLAIERNLPDLAARIALYLGWLPILFHDYVQVEHYLGVGLAYAIEHELEYWRLLVAGARVRFLLDQGRWSEADELAPTVLNHPDPVSLAKITVLIAIGRLRARRGQLDATDYLAQARTMARAHTRLEAVSASIPALAESLWLAGDGAGLLATADAALREESAALANPWWLGELAVLARRVGGHLSVSANQVAEPYALELAGNGRAAASWWRTRGCTYHAAAALASCEDPSAVSEAVSLLDQLGAAATASWARRRLRALGVSSVPRGPRPSTAAHPAGLTQREHEVLQLVAEGLTNAEIGQRLFLSARTVEHHLAAAMRKLNVATRTEAATATRLLVPKIGVPERQFR